MDDWQFTPAHDHGLPIRQQWRSAGREQGLLGKASAAAWSAWVSVHLKLLERVRVTGRDHLPASPPFVIAANHASHIDALVVAGLLPRRLRPTTYPLAAGDAFFDRPAKAAFAATLLNALPVWRHGGGHHAIDQLRGRLADQPCGLILFPEGTRSRTGEMKPFKAGLGMLVAGTSVPVIPIRLTGTHAAWPPEARLPRLGRLITAAVGEPMRFADVKNDRDGWYAVAMAVEGAVRGLAS